MIASLPKNESARLEALRQYEVLDTDPEEVFDDITRLAAYICQTPIAVISLVDEDRQWFKARIGLGPTETSRDCGDEGALYTDVRRFTFNHAGRISPWDVMRNRSRIANSRSRASRGLADAR